MSKGNGDSPHEQGARNIRMIKFMIALLCVCLAFILGFFVRGDSVLLTRLGFSSAASDQGANPGLTVSGNTYDSLSARVAEVQGILSSESLDSYDLDAATSSVMLSIVGSSDDSYLRYYDAKHYQAYLKDMSSSYAGIGVLFGEYNGKAYAVDVFSGSEAAAKDVREGDYIVAINGDRGTDGWTQGAAARAFARDEGESIVVTWRRPATLDAQGGTEYTVTLTCQKYSEPNVTTELSDSVGYIKLSQITQNSSSLVKQAITNLTAEGATSFVLDLRDNPGGYLTQAVDLGSLFVKSGVLTEIQTKEALTTKTASGALATDAPLVVLVNGNTAAAAEALVGGLQDNHRATIIGTNTLGKGSVQSIQELTFGGALRYTSAYYKTPLGYDINKVGITPDIQVSQSTDSTDDTQKTLAIETARSLKTS